MQEASSYSQMKPQFPEQEHLKCPRCDSPNTKFCYYNNYNLSQPRHFCKNCKRYWTKGGTLRNIPVGGATRKNNKRSANPKRSSSTSNLAHLPKPEPDPESIAGYGLPGGSGFDQDRRMLDVGGSFSSLLTNGQFGSMLDGLNSNGLNLNMNEFEQNPNSSSGSSLIQNTCTEYENGNNSNRESFLGVQNGGDSSCWNTPNGWPDLAIFTPVCEVNGELMKSRDMDE